MKRGEEMRTTIEDGVAMRMHRVAIQRIATTAPEFIDITDEVAAAVEASGIQDGTVTVFSRHTTAAIKINENEPLLLRDMARFLETSAPREAEYRHNDFVIRTANMTDDECPNGHSHCQHLLLGASETIPVMGGRLALGRWQSIFLVELDRPREREVIIQVQGF
ncbi:MAG: secondary thiamine-phosphate synthase enzyme YjbQ [Candidatus Bipolaricaulota bacterium]|nr:secondary thiamine-phosphate synthase enzyme YjbQ [Candidatus Bipolaricaulota bacterium]